MKNLAQLTAAVKEIAREAGKLIMQVYERNEAGMEITNKQDNSPLTEADLASHRYIVASLQALTPQYPILSEESAAIPYAERKQWQTYWLVDPLDGTREFIKRNGEFGVLIALIHEHESVLGVVHAPVLETTWYASLGNGAFKQQVNAEAKPIQTREPSDVLTIVGSRSHAGSSLQTLLEKVGTHELVSMGSILKACLVADGRADFYPRLGPTSEWDTAAAQIIVEEAGGKMLQTDFSPMRYNEQDSLLNAPFIVFGSDAINWAELLAD
ncbi:MAG: 3'(2'),5'-bisphosphate nucleotidase [Proteobacteria bacterium]|nr:MAG: 3'(2'),5'-bisphosphate nucleotidase [Pseudomonadota bacterium]